MAITPQAGYKIDPTNPNAVVRDESVPMTSGYSAPTAQPASTPVATPSPTVNVNVASPTTPATPTAPVTSTVQTPTQAPSTPANPLTIPTNGSVVDLLNQAGQASDFASRTALAGQFGIQNYTDTAQQNTDLAKKYIDFFNSKKGTTAPDQNPRADIQLGTQDKPQTQDHQQSFQDTYFALNPVAKSLYDQIQSITSSQNTQKSYVDTYKELEASQGLPALKTEYMNLKKVMDGTEDNIRTEITKAGGFATESQVQALVSARNKTFIKQANELSNQINNAEDYISHIVSLTQADRQEVTDQVYKQLGLTQQVATMIDKQNSAATDNYNSIVKAIGYDGLAKSFQGDTQGMARAEQLLGLPQGSLSNPSSLQALTTKAPTEKLQFISGTANQSSGIFNPNTGKFTSSGGGGGGMSGNTSDVPSSISTSPYAGAISTILGSGKFTKSQTQQITNAINNGEDPFTVIKNNAKNIMGQTEATKLSSYEAADSAMRALQANLQKFYDGGGDTGLISGNLEKANNRLFGATGDPKKVELATQVAISLQAYRNAISGTAYSEQEGKDIASVFPGINKSHGLNDAVISGRLKADEAIIDGIYKTALGEKTYESLKTASLPSLETTINNNLTFSSDKKTAYLPSDIWAKLGDKKDAVLADAKAHGVNLLIK